MSIEDELARSTAAIDGLTDSKAAIRAQIIAKGVAVPEIAKLDTYASYIAAISVAPVLGNVTYEAGALPYPELLLSSNKVGTAYYAVDTDAYADAGSLITAIALGTAELSGVFDVWVGDAAIPVDFNGLTDTYWLSLIVVDPAGNSSGVETYELPFITDPIPGVGTAVLGTDLEVA